MKKNLLSIIILSLLIVNIILTGIMLFSVISTNRKTAAIVTDIASILNLELDNGDGSSPAAQVSIADTEVYVIPDPMTITLQRDEGDEKDHYCIISMSLSINMKHEDYATYGADIAAKESLIKSEIISVISEYTMNEAKLSQDEICDEILKRIQALYGSDFIYKVSISDIMFG
ncbi:MAG TPA: flagellar basal body-associated FliL family protein [Lachnospiraceae bacterium]|nr:flagellar basal body-associated FliL family protein [Lachnospiraceae bacterium]